MGIKRHLGLFSRWVATPRHRVAQFKRNILIFDGLLALFFGLLVPIAGATTTGSTTTTGLTTSCGVPVSIDSLSVMQLASQLIIPTVNANSMSDASVIAAAGYGGIMVSGPQAPSNFSSQVARLQAASLLQLPLYVMTDAEGGGVMRLANKLPVVPWAQTMGKWSITRVQSTASSLGAALRSLGINMDLAPVADVDGRSQIPGALNPDGLRSFSGSPVTVGNDSVAFMRGLSSQGVLAVAKHFPGIGYSSRNSDYGPATTKTWTALQSGGLVPFRTLTSQNIPVIMMSNDSVPGFSTLPASLSPALYSYLRNTLNFTGLVMTDSLSAGAITGLHVGLSEATVRAVIAGADLVLLGRSSTVAQALSNANAARATVALAVRDGRLPLTTLQNAARAVLSAKRAQFCSN
jgi:beta-N-acetylhexosaminidase